SSVRSYSAAGLASSSWTGFIMRDDLRDGSRRISPSSRSRCAKPKARAAHRLSVGIVRKGDQGRKTGAAIRAMPNVTRVVVAPILGPHRRNQVSTALNAIHHVNLLTKMYRFR